MLLVKINFPMYFLIYFKTTCTNVKFGMIADQVYNDWCTSNNINKKMCVIPYAHFELDMAMTAYERNETEKIQFLMLLMYILVNVFNQHQFFMM